MNGASAEYVNITEPSLDAPRLTTMLVQARAIEPHPQRIARANAATDRRGLDMRNLLVGSSVRFPGPPRHSESRLHRRRDQERPSTGRGGPRVLQVGHRAH